MDIKKYFYNISHDKLKCMFKDKFDDDIYNILCSIIDSTNDIYINDFMDLLKTKELEYTNRIKEVKDISHYEYGKGLPIGNMASQFFAIFYLYELDHYIVHNFKIKYMVRYMDDYVLIDKNKDYLRYVMNEINNILKDKYDLELNMNKSKIYNIKDEFDFLGNKFKVVNKKTICKVSNKTIKWVNKRVKCMNKEYSNDNFEQYYSSINNYYYGFKHSKSLYMKK